ncbi:MAG: N-formylglutamate amidohydrolase [Planctomycetota bacterium]
MAAATRRSLVVTCEHASNAVPESLRSLSLPKSVLSQHVAWDEGALPVARAIAAAFSAPLLSGSWSRLVIDLNRSVDHPRLCAASVLGCLVPGNRGLDAAARQRRVKRWWLPFRLRAQRAVERAIAASGSCLHLSVHSFVERLHGKERKADVGLLFHPQRPRERAFVTALQRALVRRGLTVRKNFPYFGHTDGHTQSLRSVHTATRYLGIEIELNQRTARTKRGQRRFADALVEALRETVG